jgi:hypothetical protein
MAQAFDMIYVTNRISASVAALLPFYGTAAGRETLYPALS